MLAYLYLVIAVALRFLPHNGFWNFTPVGAALLFFGARQSRRHLWVPVALLALSDVLLTTVVYRYPFTADHLVTWAWYGAALLLGRLLRENAKPARVLGAALATSISFFLVSNFAVWGVGHAVDNMYPKTLAGLLACYQAAVPFFRYTLAGDLIFSAVFFGIAALLESRHRAAATVSS